MLNITNHNCQIYAFLQSVTASLQQYNEQKAKHHLYLLKTFLNLPEFFLLWRPSFHQPSTTSMTGKSVWLSAMSTESRNKEMVQEMFVRLCHLVMWAQWSVACCSFMRQILQFNALFLPSPRSQISHQLQKCMKSAKIYFTVFDEKWSCSVVRLTASNKTSSLNTDHPERWQKDQLMGTSTVWSPCSL